MSKLLYATNLLTATSVLSVKNHKSSWLCIMQRSHSNTYHIQVTGIGKYPFLAVERTDLQFGNVLVGEQVEQTVQLLNQGLLPAEFTVGPVQPTAGSLVESCIKISPTRSGIWKHRHIASQFAASTQCLESFSVSLFQVGVSERIRKFAFLFKLAPQWPAHQTILKHLGVS